jgi:SAM (Sterile alpha motif) domain-containing protein
MDIAGWLRGLGLGQYEPVFRDNDIDGAVLPSLTTEDLQDLGIASVRHRRRLLEAIAAPREGDEPTRPTAVADAAPSRLVMAGDRGSRAGKAFENAVLIAPATGELGIACR